MALSKISEIGGVIQGNWDDEHIIFGIADGNEKAGNLVGLTAAGVVDGSETTNDTVVGIQLEHYGTDMDTAPASGKVVPIVVPQSGHLYGIICADLNITTYGWGIRVGATAGDAAAAADITVDQILGRIHRYADGDTVGVFVWGE